MISQAQPFNEAALQGRLDYLNLGPDPARIRIYGTARPGNGGAPGGDPLVEIALADPAGTVTAGVLDLEPGTAEPLILNSGVAVWARIVNGNGAHAFDCDVSVEGGGGEIQLGQLELFAGGLVELVSATLG